MKILLIISVLSDIDDTRPLNVVTGTRYRHPMRGIKVQVTRVIYPKLPNNTGAKGYLLQKTAALLMLRRRVPDILTEEPLRAVGVDYLGEDQLLLQDECIMIGWHFFYNGDVIYPPKRFVLQRNMRYQQLNLVNKELYCDTLVLKYEKATDELGHSGSFVKNDIMCLRDGMYGAPLLCSSGRVVGMLMAPDAQWSNCTGYSVLVHQLNNKRNRDFFTCIKHLFEPEVRLDWSRLKLNAKDIYDEEEEIIRSIYDGVLGGSSSSSQEDA